MIDKLHLRYEPATPRWLRDCLRLTLSAYEAGLINQEIFIARLHYVFYEGADNAKETCYINCDEQFSDDPICKMGQVAGDPLLHFALSDSSPQSEWVFSVSDTDPLPSIPHGHWKLHSSQRKLDPYLGHIYHGRNRTGERLSWRECNRFWRSAAFRRFARKALQAAIDDRRMNARGHIQERGVENAFHLPR